MKLKIADIIFLILIIIITALSVDLAINSSHRQAIENISNYPPFQTLGTGLLITFWVCFIGNLLPVPTPYTFVVCFSSLPFLQINFFIPLIVGFIASLGCLVGEMGGYMIGRGAAELISDNRLEKLKNYQQYLIDHSKLAPILIFLFGFTPLNDDMITVPLGIIKYNAKKTILFVWLGKLGLMLIFAYNVFNICQLIGGENWIFSIATLYFTVITVYLMLKVDFTKLFNLKLD
ncbi:MAG: VTT domain-containing protein [Candidatus Lokiarchaeota archaeon]|nr:VTT domain-containing protein [Candidatus Lokiarchaeota archaeon]